jgi:S-DNA-T family DNA segregation ATPase FtsK/SpoIIIE
VEVQVALLHPDPAASAQAGAVREIAERLTARWDGLPAALRPRRLDPLPVEITAAQAERLRTAARTTPLTCTPAVGGHHLGPVDVDLADCDGTFVIAGPARSGRSTALVAAVRSLAGPVEVLAVAPRPSPLRAAAVRLVDPHDLAGVLAEAAHPVVLAVDDAERLTDPVLGDALEDFARSCRDTGNALLAAAATEDLLLNRFRGWLPQARRSRCGLLLNPASHLDGEVFELRLPRSLAGTWPPGRGLLVRRGETTLTQVPLSEGPARDRDLK